MQNYILDVIAVSSQEKRHGVKLSTLELDKLRVFGSITVRRGNKQFQFEAERLLFPREVMTGGTEEDVPYNYFS